MKATLFLIQINKEEKKQRSGELAWKLREHIALAVEPEFSPSHPCWVVHCDLQFWHEEI